MIWAVFICAATAPASLCRPVPDGAAYTTPTSCERVAAYDQAAIKRDYDAPVVLRCAAMREVAR